MSSKTQAARNHEFILSFYKSGRKVMAAKRAQHRAEARDPKLGSLTFDDFERMESMRGRR